MFTHVTRLTSGEAVRAVLGCEHEAGPGLCDAVEAGLAAWEAGRVLCSRMIGFLLFWL